MMRIAPLVLSSLLVLCALALVTSQYRARELFAELEVSQQDAKALDAEGSRLRSELGRASQPAIVETAARRLGLRPISPDRIVILPSSAASVPPPADPQAKGAR